MAAPKQHAVYSKKAKMIFTLQSNGEYEPYFYDVEEYEKDGKIRHKGKKIEKDTIFFDYIAFVRHASDDIDKNTGKKRRGYGEMYQYAIGFQVVKSCMNLEGEDIIVAISRQAGKSHIVRKTFAFCLIFIPKYAYIPQLRYYMTFVAVKNDLAVDQINKLQPSIDQSIELFNMMNPETPIVSGLDDKSLINTKMKKEYNRIIHGKSIPYSAMDGISFQSKVSAGYTSHCLVVDEAQEVEDEKFNIQIAPFVTATGGVRVAIGTTLPDVSNVLFNMYMDKEIPDERKVIYNWEEVYDMKHKSNPTRADKYKNRVEKEIKKYGMKSTYIRTQYYCEFAGQGDRFMTMEQLEDNNIFRGDRYGFPNILDEGAQKYRIAGFDPATVDDYAVLTSGYSWFDTNKDARFELLNCEIMNKNSDKITSRTIAEYLTTYCLEHKIDMLIVDATASQEDKVFATYIEMLKRGCKTLLIPFKYTNRTKTDMMMNFQDMVFSQRISFPNKSYLEIYEDFAEMVDEVCYLKVEKTDSGLLKFKAPDGTSFFDDAVMSLSQSAYLITYIRQEYKRGRIIDLGDGIKYKLRFNKFSTYIPTRMDRINEYKY